MPELTHVDGKVMSRIELTTKQELANGFSSPSELGEAQAGKPLPIRGAHEQGVGVNFVLFSHHATSVRLEFYEHPDDSSPAKIIDLDPVRHRTGDVWHIWVRGISAGQLYGYFWLSILPEPRLTTYPAPGKSLPCRAKSVFGSNLGQVQFY